jgi:UDP-perosamine 4-acetyltransferase
VAIASRDEPMRGATANDPFSQDAGAVADATGATTAGVLWLGDPDSAEGAARIHAEIARGARVIIAVGHVELRVRWAKAFAESVAEAIVDPLASVLPSAMLERGTFVAACAVVQTRAVVHAHAIINTRAVVEHDSIIGTRAHVAPGAVLCGGVVVGEDALVGAGAVVLPNIRIGANAVVGAGSVVTANVPDGATVRGVPAHA